MKKSTNRVRFTYIVDGAIIFRLGILAIRADIIPNKTNPIRVDEITISKIVIN
jgi:hypothetical protein